MKTVLSAYIEYDRCAAYCNPLDAAMNGFKQIQLAHSIKTIRRRWEKPVADGLSPDRHLYNNRER
jgi:hypothetical protein